MVRRTLDVCSVNIRQPQCYTIMNRQWWWEGGGRLFQLSVPSRGHQGSPFLKPLMTTKTTQKEGLSFSLLVGKKGQGVWLRMM